MKISVCIPQYNRINYLLRSLKEIAGQTYNDIEVVISDDASSDNTPEEIKKLIPEYKFPLIYSRNPINKGFDYNYRKSIELATGDYAIVIGNDDTLYQEDSIAYLADFLKKNDYPDIGFCNCIEERTGNTLMKRAHINGVLGEGVNTALKYYSSFSFVGGLIYKKSSFNKYNTDKHDGSVYSQMYLGVYMIASGCKLFSVTKPLVVKDILIDNIFRHSYRDRIAKRWKDYRICDSGLPKVINVLIHGFKDAGCYDQQICYRIFKRIYTVTYPFWIQDYKSNQALPEAVGLVQGLYPFRNNNFALLNLFNRSRIFCFYMISTFAGLVTPNYFFRKIQNRLYQWMKK